MIAKLSLAQAGRPHAPVVDAWDPAHAQAVVQTRHSPPALATQRTPLTCDQPTSPYDRARSDAIMADYGLPGGRHEAYEIDHLIPP